MDTINPPSSDALLKLIQQVRDCYCELPPEPLRGRPQLYQDHSFLLLAVVAVVLRTFKERELQRLLTKDAGLQKALGFVKVPHRRTIQRRMQALIPAAEAQIAALGQQLAEDVPPSAAAPQVSAIDGRMYEAQGPLWHQKHRKQGLIPRGLRNVDTDSAWSKSGYRGWVQGYRLLMQVLVFPEPVPLTAFWRSNREGEATLLAQALDAHSYPVTSVLLGDQSFGGADLRATYAAQGGWLLTPVELSKTRRSWKHDLYAYRRETIELMFQRVIQACGLEACPVKGWSRNGAFVLASVWLYQVVFLNNYRSGQPAAEVKELVDLARWRIAA